MSPFSRESEKPYVTVLGSGITTTHGGLPRQKWGFPWLWHGPSMDFVLPDSHWCLVLGQTYSILESDAISLLFHSHQGVPQEEYNCDSKRWCLSLCSGVWAHKGQSISIPFCPWRTKHSVISWVYSCPRQSPPLTALPGGWQWKKTIYWMPGTQAWRSG